MPTNASEGPEGANWRIPEEGPAARQLPPPDRRLAEPAQGYRIGGRTYATGPVVSAPPPKRRLWLHVLLFLASVATTSLMISPVYSVCLMGILTAHEFGHYFAARYHRVPATLPYFIPAPSLFGTLGAVIRMSPLIPNRRALFDIAAAGPLAGVVLAVPISFVGLMLSTYQVVDDDRLSIMVGDPLLFQVFRRMIFGGTEPEGMVLMLHDVGFAGWVGLFVTALNLIPISQLDGGHISHAVFSKLSARVSWVAFVGMLAICLVVNWRYAPFLLLLLFFMKIRHPPTLDESLPLDRGRKRMALVLLAVFVLCFTPDPIRIG